MLWFGISLLALLVVGLILIYLYRNRNPRLNVSRRTTLLEPYVRAFKQQLERALGDEFDVFSQVRLAELVLCDAAKDKASQALLQKIQATSVDFVLVEKGSGKISCVLVLVHHDMPGHRQLFIKQVCEHGKLPFLQIDDHNALNDKQIRQKIKALLEPTIVLEQTSSQDIKVYLDPGHRSDNKQHDADSSA